MLLEKLTKIENERDELLKEVDKYKDFDPLLLENRRKEAQVAKTSANRWTGKES